MTRCPETSDQTTRRPSAVVSHPAPARGVTAATAPAMSVPATRAVTMSAKLALTGLALAILALAMPASPAAVSAAAPDPALPGGGAEPKAPAGPPASAAPAAAATPGTSGPMQPAGRLNLTVRKRPDLVDEATAKAVEDGLKWLADRQNSDGSWSGDPSAYGGAFPVAMTGLAGLAFLAHGDTPDRGPYAPVVKKALAYLLGRFNKDGMLTSDGEAMRPMYGHGFALLFLGELHGMESDTFLGEKIRVGLDQGVKLIGKGQSARGGWFYTPESGRAGQDEGSVTVTAVQALRSAKNAGVQVPKEMIERGIKYIIDCQQHDGGIRYSYTHRGDSRPAISAAAVATLYGAGVYERSASELAELRKRGELSDAEIIALPAIRRCLAYCDDIFGFRGDRLHVDPPMVQGFMFYTHLYLAQAMWASGDPEWRDRAKTDKAVTGPYWRWEKYYPKISEWLLNSPRSTRQPDGSWLGDNPGPGKLYGTAVACIVLQIPWQNLPIWQR